MSTVGGVPIAVSEEAACDAGLVNWVPDKEWVCQLPAGHRGTHYSQDRGVSVEWRQGEQRP